MKRFLLAATAAVGLAAVASVASAQTVTGTIDLTGSVQSKCTVSPGDGSTFADTWALGELAGANGTLRDDLEGATAVAAAQETFTVHCTGANVTASVAAAPMVNAATAPTGYDDTINYTARATIQRADLADLVVTDSSAVAAATTAPLAGYLANVANNVKVEAYSFNTTAATDLLVAGAYNGGQIVVTLTPVAAP